MPSSIGVRFRGRRVLENKLIKLQHHERLILYIAASLHPPHGRTWAVHDDHNYVRFMLRPQHEAHVVMVVVNSQCPGDAVGGAMPATRKNQAFVVLKFNQLVLVYTPAHEIGHLFGAGHEVGPYSVHNHPLEDGEFALGHVTEEWRTIMAYLNRKDGKSYGAEVIPHFGDPDVQYNGTATRDRAGE